MSSRDKDKRSMSNQRTKRAAEHKKGEASKSGSSDNTNESEVHSESAPVGQKSPIRQIVKRASQNLRQGAHSATKALSNPFTAPKEIVPDPGWPRSRNPSTEGLMAKRTPLSSSLDKRGAVDEESMPPVPPLPTKELAGLGIHPSQSQSRLVGSSPKPGPYHIFPAPDKRVSKTSSSTFSTSMSETHNYDTSKPPLIEVLQAYESRDLKSALRGAGRWLEVNRMTWQQWVDENPDELPYIPKRMRDAPGFGLPAEVEELITYLEAQPHFRKDWPFHHVLNTYPGKPRIGIAWLKLNAMTWEEWVKLNPTLLRHVPSWWTDIPEFVLPSWTPQSGHSETPNSNLRCDETEFEVRSLDTAGKSPTVDREPASSRYEERFLTGIHARSGSRAYRKQDDQRDAGAEPVVSSTSKSQQNSPARTPKERPQSRSILKKNPSNTIPSQQHHGFVPSIATTPSNTSSPEQPSKLELDIMNKFKALHRTLIRAFAMHRLCNELIGDEDLPPNLCEDESLVADHKCDLEVARSTARQILRELMRHQLIKSYDQRASAEGQKCFRKVLEGHAPDDWESVYEDLREIAVTLRL